MPRARSGEDFTLLFESFAMTLCREMPANKVSQIIGEDDNKLWRMIQYYVEEARKLADYSNVKSIGIDGEKQMVTVGMPVARHPPHRSIHYYDKLYLIYFFQDHLKFIISINHYLLDGRFMMGQAKYYRYNIKQQLHSLEFKNKHYYLKNINLSRYGLCPAEAELLAEIANNYYQNELLDVPENYFSISLYKKLSSNKKQSFGNLSKVTIPIPAFSHHELEMYQHHGLQALQTLPDYSYAR